METPQVEGMNNWEVETLIRENSKIANDIAEMKRRIIKLEEKKDQNDKIIFKQCIHDWEYDPNAFLDRTKFFCKKCTLWRNSCWYS